MRRVHLAELRDSWPAWLGVAISFVAVNTALVVSGVILYSGTVAMEEGRLDFTASAAYTIVQGIILVMTCCVAVPVIRSATGLVVDSRRGSLARLGLAGATPSQVRRTVLSQLVAVSLACAVVGDLMGVALVRPMLDLIDHSNRAEPLHVSIEASYGLSPILAANLLCVLVALAGGRRQARLASEIPPVEALRQAQAPHRATRLGASGWVGAVLLGLVLAACFASVPLQVANRYKETVSNLLTMGFLQVFLWGAFVAALAPVSVAPLTRAWTRLVPVGAPSWVLARATAGARADRLARSVTPVMFTVGISVGSVGAGESMMATLRASSEEVLLGGPGIDTFVMLFGLPLLVAFAGSVGSLLMMSRQRDAELALAGIMGATPRQRVALPALEAVIITGTAVALALAMVAPVYVFQAYSLTMIGLTYVPVLPVTTLLASVVVCLLVTAAATTLPTLPAQRRPETRVIARLVAE